MKGMTIVDMKKVDIFVKFNKSDVRVIIVC